MFGAFLKTIVFTAPECVSMKFMKSGLLAALLIGAAGTANAVPYTWVDYIDFVPDVKVQNWQTYAYEHDIKQEGFTPLSDSIDGYSLIIDLYDDGDAEAEKVLVQVPNFLGQGNQTFFDLSGQEFGGWSIVGWAQLMLTGELDVAITSKTGDFYLASSTLTVWGNETSNKVPEPATLGLMGLGLLGIGALARRKKRS